MHIRPASSHSPAASRYWMPTPRRGCRISALARRWAMQMQNDVARVTIDMRGRERVRLLRVAEVRACGERIRLAAGALATVTADEAERLVGAGDAERVPGGMIVT